MPSSLRPVVLLAAFLLPVAARAGAAIDLLDAGRVDHPVLLVELLVHGHAHGGRLPAHDHAARVGPGTSGTADPGPVPGAPAARQSAPQGTGHEVSGSDAAERALSSSPPRHVLLVSLRR
ncbi:hypothetical protein FBQ97_19645 [Acidobacteria bacterium ACD]|nr:hypothetical protein [Acidobacteria bacterium ACD]